MSHKPIISPVFNQPGAKFVLMPIGEKFPPIEKEWQNKGHTFQEAAEHKGNVGIMAGNGFIGLIRMISMVLPVLNYQRLRGGKLALVEKGYGSDATTTRQKYWQSMDSRRTRHRSIFSRMTTLSVR